jgi:CubicO group peptidase (beta-lactamase class C family)
MSDGAIRSLDQPVVEWFPEYPELNTPDRRRITLEHVITMTSGLDWNEDVPSTDPANDEIVMNAQAEPLRYALSRPIVATPGAVFDYNGGMTHVMGAVIERATKVPIEDYARLRLFEPLGIDKVEWVGNLAGMPAVASGLRLRARDLARFGSMYLHGGKWQGRQILPAEWVARSTRRHTRFTATPARHRGNREVPDGGEFGYGYFWWYSCHPTKAGLVEARTAVGNGQQRVIVLPGLDMVVTMFAGRYNDVTVGNTLATRILREHVVPAVRTGLTTGCPGA